MMEYSNFILDLISANSSHLIKPEIKFGNYFFKWNEKSFGIYSTEIAKFKGFIKKSIPYLEFIMKIINDIHSIPNSKNSMKKEILENGNFSISNKYNSNIIFILFIDIDGATTLFREEQVILDRKTYDKIINQDKSNDIRTINNLKDFDRHISIKWSLGNLLFDRKGKDNIKA